MNTRKIDKFLFQRNDASIVNDMSSFCNAVDLQIEIKPNPSKFAVFSVIRSAVLSEKLEKKCNQKNSEKKLQKNLDDDTKSEAILHEDDIEKHSNEVAGHKIYQVDKRPKGSQIVRGGLKALFVLLKETKQSSPHLCGNALFALYELLQDQDPENFQNEPESFFELLYDSLLEMATSDYIDDAKGLNKTWSSISFSTLVSLCVAVGAPAKLLKLLQSSIVHHKSSLLDQCVPLPIILIKLQRYMQFTIAGRNSNDNISQFPQYYNKECLIDNFNIKQCLLDDNYRLHKSLITTDGRYVYLLIVKTLYKIGSGFNGTLKGKCYAVNKFLEIYDWIGFCKDMLVCKKSSIHNDMVFAIDTNTLSLKGTVPILKTKRHSNIFTDGQSLLQIFCQKDDSLLIQHVYGDVSCSDCSVKLSNTKFRAFGFAQFEEELLDDSKKIQVIESYNPFEPLVLEGELSNIACGKEFGLVISSTGKVYAYGKLTSLGVKSGTHTSSMQLTELCVSKNTNITQIAIGHDGYFAILKTDTGSVFFTGTATRGEDGEAVKNRRQIRPAKPKKVLRMDKFIVIDVSCNNGTSAFVTKSGKLFMFGKDTNHCDSNGFVTRLHDQHIVKVCLGKAHCVVLNTKGEMFTFGLNNKYQCGYLPNKDVKMVGSHSDPLKSELDGDGSVNMSDVDSQLITSLPPTRVHLPGTVIQFACGLYHTVVLTCIDDLSETSRTGFEVYTFGSNQYGQLGTGDFFPHIGPICIELPETIVQVTSGSNHTCCLSKAGNVYTFGSYKRGQLGRIPENYNQIPTSSKNNEHLLKNVNHQEEIAAKRNTYWHCTPEIIKTLGPKSAKRVIWVAAFGDQTFIGLDEVLINADMLNKTKITADAKTILLLPMFATKYKAITIDRKNGSCKPHFALLHEQLDCAQADFSVLLIDPFNDVLYAFNANTFDLSIYNILSAVVKKNFYNPEAFLPGLSSEIALPVKPDVAVTRIQIILNLLYTLDIMISHKRCLDTYPMKSKMSLSPNFTNMLSKDSFESLMIVLNWSWSFLLSLIDSPNDEWTMKNKNHARYLCKVTISLLKKNTNKIYPATEDDKSSSVESLDTDKTNKKNRQENVHLVECIIDFRSMIIKILTEDIPPIKSEDCNLILDVLDEASKAFVDCFCVFYPNSFFKWNCLCELLIQIDGGIMPSLLLASVILGLCTPFINLTNIFPLLTQKPYKPFTGQDDNFSTPTSGSSHKYPILVEKMIYRKQKEKKTSLSHSWGLKEILVRILNIISRPVRLGIENIYHNQQSNVDEFKRTINHKLVESCCQLLIKMMTEIIFRNGTFEYDMCSNATNTMYNSGNRFLKYDVNIKSWNPGNFTPDAIAFSSDTGISIAGVSVFAGTGSYKYQLELLSNNQDSKYQTTNLPKWELLETVTGSFSCPEMVQNDMVEIKFMRSVRIKENTKYALKYCSKGAKTCSGESGSSVLNTSCGVTLKFFSCDLSFNGTTATRGQIPCILFFRAAMPQELPSENSKEVHSKQIAMQITTDITKRCCDLLTFARTSISTHYAPNPSNIRQHMDAEHNITPVEEHFHIDWDQQEQANCSSKISLQSIPNSAQKITKKIEILSKGLIETLKFDRKTSTNPFNLNFIEVDAAKEIEENISQINGNLGYQEKTINNIRNNPLQIQEEDETTCKKNKIIELFSSKDACLFHELLPYIYAVLGPILNDAKISVQIMMLIKVLLPHIVALKQESGLKDDKAMENSVLECCVIESDHPYKSSSITTYTVEFSSSVKWMSIEFSPLSGTSQAEDYLKLSIPKDASIGKHDQSANKKPKISVEHKTVRDKLNWYLVKKFNTSSNWCSNAILLPGNKLELSLETASNYLKYPKSNRYGFKCNIIGYDYDNEINGLNSCLDRIENELAFLGGLCCSNLMKNNSGLPDLDNQKTKESIQKHYGMLSKGMFVSSSKLAINNVLEYDLPIEAQSYERQFLKDFINLAAGSTGARLANWLHPESRLDPNKSQLSVLQDGAIRSEWPTQILIITRDQYSEPVTCPDIKINLKISCVSVAKKFIKRPHLENIESEQSSNVSTLHISQLSQIVYEPTLKEKERAFIKAITAMEEYNKYSFEELRFSCPFQNKTTETLTATELGDHRYTALWIPKFAGNYNIKMEIDGVVAEEIYKIIVIDAGTPPPPEINVNKKISSKKKVKRFIIKSSAGLRIRLHPTTQSPEVGIIKYNETVSFIDELENDEGTWISLSTESIRLFCSSKWFPDCGYCLQFNRHSNKTLLQAVENPDTDNAETSVKIKRQFENINLQQHLTLNKLSYVDRSNQQQSDFSKSVKDKITSRKCSYKGIRVGFENKSDSIDKPDLDNDSSLCDTSNNIPAIDEDESDAIECGFQQTDFVQTNVLKTEVDNVNFRRRKPIRKTISPSIAETLRAVFAALLWHEGMVHDAMASSSYLKFYPNIHKYFASEKNTFSDENYTKESKVSQRHSVEIGMFSFMKLNKTYRKTENDLQKKNQSLVDHGLPPALRCLVYVWDHLCSTFIQLQEQGPNKAETKSDDTDEPIRINQNGDNQGIPKIGECSCELCDIIFQSSIHFQIHMKTLHVGCGRPSFAGYNSRGNFVYGFVGNCGEILHAYLLCTQCRERYFELRLSSTTDKNDSYNFQSSCNNIFGINATVHSELFLKMKENAYYLLELNPQNNDTYQDQKKMGLYWTIPKEFACLQQEDDINNCSDCKIETISITSVDSQITNDYMTLETKTGFSGNMSGKKVHRSYSMGQGWQNFTMSEENDQTNVPETTAVLNKQSCSSENVFDSSLLRHPSKNLIKLVPVEHIKKCLPDVKDPENGKDLLNLPSLVFILEQNDLEKLRNFMLEDLRKNLLKIFALQGFNFLIHSVTKKAVHDILWWFVSSVTPVIKDSDDIQLEHPVTEFSLSEISILSDSLHMFLQSVSDITLRLNASSQTIAMQCFGMKFFKNNDNSFLHKCHVFSNISKILSRSEEQKEEMLSMSQMKSLSEKSHSTSIKVQQLEDITNLFEITVSRQALANYLTDNSTETFWECEEGEKNKTVELFLTKSIATCIKLNVCIDNTRDVLNKVISITSYGGSSHGEKNLIETVNVDPDNNAWISIANPDLANKYFLLEFKGAENTVRVRQIKVMGYSSRNNFDNVIKMEDTFYLQNQICEIETLKVFRLLTNQVFGDLICDTGVNKFYLKKDISPSNLHPSTESLDLREHMVGILFSRNKLTHLQKQVIVHIVQAIRKESQHSLRAWLVNYASDSFKNSQVVEYFNGENYCFEMLSLVLALSGSSVGRLYLSKLLSLFKDLLCLLHTSSDRVQRQVILLIRRILPVISPELFCEVLQISQNPINDTSNSFDMHRMGVMDIFISIIAKAMHTQSKIKTKNQDLKNFKNYEQIKMSDFVIKTSKQRCVTPPLVNADLIVDLSKVSSNASGKRLYLQSSSTSHIKDETEHLTFGRWFMRGPTISAKQAESMIILMKDILNEKLGIEWAQTAKAAVADCVMNMTKLEGKYKNPNFCLETPTLWLALASLCILDGDHVEKLTSNQWKRSGENKQTFLCDNHDDGQTLALIQCDNCGYLCETCNLILHLNRKKQSHKRTLCNEEEESIQVELHESCGRLKLYWLLLLADSKTLKGVVEFRDGDCEMKNDGTNTGRCRFCGLVSNMGLLSVGNVCADQNCQDLLVNACSKILTCGHFCGGITEEQNCLPCLVPNCGNKSELMPKLTQDIFDMCMICFTETLSCAPSIQLVCGHVFHYHCCRAVLNKRWHGARISFGFLLCPICKTEIYHESLRDQLESILELKKDVKRKALLRLKYDGSVKYEFDDHLELNAIERYAYYLCCKCKKPYFGGEARCDVELGEKYNPDELICGGCSGAKICPKHGTDFLEYKCKFCCSVAVYFCFGTTHFCDTCHDDFQRLTNIPKNKLPKCPAGPKATQKVGECPLFLNHPPTGEEFALGCGICRNAQTF